MNQTSAVKMSRRQRLAWRFNRWLWPKLLRPVSWLFWHTSIHKEAHKTNLMNGLHEAFWTFMCGHGVRYSLHIGNIWWGVHFNHKDAT
jgi:hypothetical protein